MRRLLVTAVLALVAAACHPSEGWEALPPSPLGPRHGAVAVGLGDELLVVGGWDFSWCSGNADCNTPAPPERTGAILDIDAGRWRTIAPAPVPIAASGGVAVDRIVYLLVPGIPNDETDGQPPDAFVAYDAAADRWQQLPLPPNAPFVRLVRTGRGTIVAARGSEELGERGDALFDPATRTWTDLPIPPITPGFDRSLVRVGRDLVLLDLGIDDDRRPWPPYRVTFLDLDTMRWRRRADAPVRGTSPVWIAVDGLVVNPTVGASGSRIGGILEPRRWTWQDLPELPGHDGPTYVAAGDGFVVSSAGWALDVSARHWIDVPELDHPRSAGVAWADGGIVVFGGQRFDDPDDVGEPVGDGWIWRPPHAD